MYLCYAKEKHVIENEAIHLRSPARDKENSKNRVLRSSSNPSLLLRLIQAGLNTFRFSRRRLCCRSVHKSELIRWFVRTSLLFCCCLYQSEREQSIPDGGQHPGHHVVQTCHVNSWDEHGVPVSVCVWAHHFTRDKEDGRKNIQE